MPTQTDSNSNTQCETNELPATVAAAANVKVKTRRVNANKKHSKTRKVERAPLSKEEMVAIWNKFQSEQAETKTETETAAETKDAAGVETAATKPDPMFCIYTRCVEPDNVPAGIGKNTTAGCAWTNGSEVSKRTLCEMCSSVLVINEEGHMECPNSRCAIIYTDVLDHSPEWRFYGADDANGTDPARCGMPIDPLFENTAYGCKMYSHTGTSHEMRKVGQFTKWMSMPYRETKLYNDMQHIATFSRLAHISQKIIDDACSIYVKLFNADQRFRGTNREGLMASSLYFACLQNQCARTVKEISNVFHIDPSVTTNGCKLSQRILIEWNESVTEESEKIKLLHATPDQFVERYCSYLQWDKEKTTLARFVARRVVQMKEMQENTPNAVCAGILYFIAKTFRMETTKHEISEICDMSEVTISKCCAKLESMASQLLPKQFQSIAAATSSAPSPSPSPSPSPLVSVV